MANQEQLPIATMKSSQTTTTKSSQTTMKIGNEGLGEMGRRRGTAMNKKIGDEGLGEMGRRRGTAMKDLARWVSGVGR